MLTLGAHILRLYDWNNEYCNFYRVAQFTFIVTASVLFVVFFKLKEKNCRLSLNLGNIVRVMEYLTATESSSTALWLWASDTRFSVARRHRSLPLCCSASHESTPSSRPTSQTEHSALSHLYPSPPPWPTERGVAQEGSESRHKLQNMKSCKGWRMKGKELTRLHSGRKKPVEQLLTHLSGHVSGEIAVRGEFEMTAVACFVVHNVNFSWLKERHINITYESNEMPHYRYCNLRATFI